MPNVQLLSAVTAANSPPVEFCTGSITTVAVADLVDGELITITGLNANTQENFTYVFEIDKTGNGVASGNTQVNVSADTTADEVRDRLVTAINSTTIPITAASGGAATVSLTADYGGPEGNFKVAETVANGTFAASVTACTSGVLLDDFQDDEETSLILYSTAGSGTMTVTCKLWLFDLVARRWYPAGTHATDASKGLINEGNAMGETGTNSIRHTELVYGLRHYKRAYLEITTIGGTNTAITAYLQSRRLVRS